jgi:hypothetical protein
LKQANHRNIQNLQKQKQQLEADNGALLSELTKYKDLSAIQSNKMIQLKQQTEQQLEQYQEKLQSAQQRKNEAELLLTDARDEILRVKETLSDAENELNNLRRENQLLFSQQETKRLEVQVRLMFNPAFSNLF